ncbi:MAG TPA: hypothetical protein VMC80_00715 [Patescibacteria group bacterium]|nr:hypothetical protein [Patescibacteria group bacterium]
MMRVFLIIIIFFVTGALFIISNNNLSVYHQENFSTFSKMYAGWLGDIYSNVVNMTGYLVKLDWLPNKS